MVPNRSLWKQSKFYKGLETVADSKRQTVPLVQETLDRFLHLHILECGCEKLSRTVRLVAADAEEAWKGTLEKVFPTNSNARGQEEKVEKGLYDAKEVHICNRKIGMPTVFITVFPGPNAILLTAAAIPCLSSA